MRRATAIQKDLVQIGTIEDLASVFEGIASMQIAKIKNQVVMSKQFFADLWHIYSQLRVDSDRLTNEAEITRRAAQRDLFVVITSQGGLSGDIDRRIVEWMLKQYDPKTTDLIVMGGHGATLLAQMNVPITKYFKLPENDQSIEVGPIINELGKYRNAAAFYQTYVSLAVQQVARIDLISAVKALSAEKTSNEGEIISNRDYDFEPTQEEVVQYLESVMLGIALGQVILESKLAQYASRFNAMSAAKTKAKEIEGDLNLDYHRSKRGESDERAKEVINSMYMQ